MEEKILIDDLESSDENMFVDVIYKGLPFSGVAYEDSEYSYLNGFGHGRSFSKLEVNNNENRRICTIW
jgi:hypothetical protein